MLVNPADYTHTIYTTNAADTFKSNKYLVPVEKKKTPTVMLAEFMTLLESDPDAKPEEISPTYMEYVEYDLPTFGFIYASYIPLSVTQTWGAGTIITSNASTCNLSAAYDSEVRTVASSFITTL